MGIDPLASLLQVPTTPIRITALSGGGPKNGRNPKDENAKRDEDEDDFSPSKTNENEDFDLSSLDDLDGLTSDTIEAFKTQIKSPLNCLEKSGDKSIINKECWAIPLVLRALLLKSMGVTLPPEENPPDYVGNDRKPGIITFAADINKDLPFGDALVDGKRLRHHGESMLKILRKFQKTRRNRGTAPGPGSGPGGGGSGGGGSGPGGGITPKGGNPLALVGKEPLKDHISITKRLTQIGSALTSALTTFGRMTGSIVLGAAKTVGGAAVTAGRFIKEGAVDAALDVRNVASDLALDIRYAAKRAGKLGLGAAGVVGSTALGVAGAVGTTALSVAKLGTGIAGAGVMAGVGVSALALGGLAVTLMGLYDASKLVVEGAKHILTTLKPGSPEAAATQASLKAAEAQLAGLSSATRMATLAAANAARDAADTTHSIIYNALLSIDSKDNESIHSAGTDAMKQISLNDISLAIIKYRNAIDDTQGAPDNTETADKEKAAYNELMELINRTNDSCISALSIAHPLLEYKNTHLVPPASPVIENPAINKARFAALSAYYAVMDVRGKLIGAWRAAHFTTTYADANPDTKTRFNDLFEELSDATSNAFNTFLPTWNISTVLRNAVTAIDTATSETTDAAITEANQAVLTALAIITESYPVKNDVISANSRFSNAIRASADADTINNDTILAARAAASAALTSDTIASLIAVQSGNSLIRAIEQRHIEKQPQIDYTAITDAIANTTNMGAQAAAAANKITNDIFTLRKERTDSIIAALVTTTSNTNMAALASLIASYPLINFYERMTTSPPGTVVDLYTIPAIAADDENAKVKTDAREAHMAVMAAEFAAKECRISALAASRILSFSNHMGKLAHRYIGDKNPQMAQAALDAFNAGQIIDKMALDAANDLQPVIANATAAAKAVLDASMALDRESTDATRTALIDVTKRANDTALAVLSAITIANITIDAAIKADQDSRNIMQQAIDAGYAPSPVGSGGGSGSGSSPPPPDTAGALKDAIRRFIETLRVGPSLERKLHCRSKKSSTVANLGIALSTVGNVTQAAINTSTAAADAASAAQTGNVAGAQAAAQTAQAAAQDASDAISVSNIDVEVNNSNGASNGASSGASSPTGPDLAAATSANNESTTNSVRELMGDLEEEVATEGAGGGGTVNSGVWLRPPAPLPHIQTDEFVRNVL